MQLPERLKGFAARRARRVHVGFDEAGNHGLPAGIDGLCLRADSSPDLGVGADRDEHAILDGNGRRLAGRAVEREHVAVDDNEVRGCVGRGSDGAEHERERGMT